MPKTEGNTPETGGEDLGNDLLGLAGNDNPEENNEEGSTPGDDSKESSEEDKGEENTEQKAFSQEEVNALLAKQKREYQEKVKKLRDAGLSDEQIELIEAKGEQGSQENLEQIRQERIKLILDQNKDLAGNLSSEYLDQLKQAAPEQVSLMFENIRNMTNKQEPEQQPSEGAGELGSMEDGKTNIDGVPSEDMAIAEGIQNFEKTGDPTQMVEKVIQSWKF